MAFAALLGMFLFLTYYFQGNLGYSALKSAFAFLPFSAGIIGGGGTLQGAPQRCWSSSCLLAALAQELALFLGGAGLPRAGRRRGRRSGRIFPDQPTGMRRASTSQSEPQLRP